MIFLRLVRRQGSLDFPAVLFISEVHCLLKSVPMVFLMLRRALTIGCFEKSLCIFKKLLLTLFFSGHKVTGPSCNLPVQNKAPAEMIKHMLIGDPFTGECCELFPQQLTHIIMALKNNRKKCWRQNMKMVMKKAVERKHGFTEITVKGQG